MGGCRALPARSLRRRISPAFMAVHAVVRIKYSTTLFQCISRRFSACRGFTLALPRPPLYARGMLSKMLFARAVNRFFAAYCPVQVGRRGAYFEAT